MATDIRKLLIQRYKAQGMTRSQLAHRAGVNSETLSKWFRGVRQTTNTDILTKLLRALNLTVAGLEELRPIEPVDTAIQRLKEEMAAQKAAQDEKKGYLDRLLSEAREQTKQMQEQRDRYRKELNEF